MVLEQTKLWSRVPMAPETKNDFAGENQQQFTGIMTYTDWTATGLEFKSW
jgi:hypothetical protein